MILTVTVGTFAFSLSDYVFVFNLFYSGNLGVYQEMQKIQETICM